MIRFLQLLLLRLLLLLLLLVAFPTPFAAAPSSTASSVAAYKVHLARLLFPPPTLLSTLLGCLCLCSF